MGGITRIRVHIFSKIFDFRKISSPGVFGVADHEFGIYFVLYDIYTKIEANWGHLKTKIIRQMRGIKEHLIPGHLAEYWWKGLHKKTTFWDIIAEISRQCPLVQ